MEEVRRIWDDTLGLVRGQLNTPTFKTWFEQTHPLGIIDDTLVVSVQNDFARDWMESRYADMLRAVLVRVAGAPNNVSFTVSADQVARPAPAALPAAPPVETASSAPSPSAVESVVEFDLREAEERRLKEAAEGAFNTKYTFDSFVMGSSNQFAYHAALAVAEAPGNAYNPLFIYGGVGLGKTHLLQAIAHYVTSHFPHLKVRYVSSEQFMNDFINSIRDKNNSRTDGFRKKYRNIDVLLIDDIQFIADKEQTQVEFFHTFNTLQQAGKQIVMSSDRPPKEISPLEERLRSRFEMGLMTDIQPPELETRIAILKRKCDLERLMIDDGVLQFVADRVSSNIRELEGALTRVIAYSSLTSKSVDLELAKAVLKDIFPERSMKPISIATIQQEVCRFFGISKAELVGGKRSQSIVYPRQIAMYLARELTDHSLPKIGSEFGGRDHTTVMHATAKIQKLISAQRDVYNQIQTLTNMVKQRD